MSTLVVVLLLCVLILAAYLFHRFAYAPFQVLKRCGIKGPTPVPFFGNYRQLAKTTLINFHAQLIEKYGQTVGYYLGRRPMILITDPEMIKEIAVKQFNNFSDHQPVPNLTSRRAVGVNMARGDDWRFARRILSPTFSSSKMRQMVPILKKRADTLVEILSSKSSSGESFDVARVFNSFTLETILAAAFGRSIDIQRGKADELTEAVKSIFVLFQEGQNMSLDMILMLYSHLSYSWCMSAMRFAVEKSLAGKVTLKIEELILNLIKARRESDNPEKYKDLLQLMIDASSEEENKAKDEVGGEMAELPSESTAATHDRRKLTDDEIMANSFTFLLAGYETSAAALSYTSYLLALNPDIQEKLQAEIDEYFEDKPDSSLYEAAQSITYLDNVLQESLRIYPPAVRLDRYCEKTITIKGVTIPEGAVVAFPVHWLHHSPLYWKEPEVFSPDRFTDEERTKRPQLCHMPFGYGPRNCIGMRFALLEIKIALIEVLKRYSFVRAPDTEVPLQTVVGITLAPKNGIFLKVINRY